jgi:Uma2 family endonuclease
VSTTAQQLITAGEFEQLPIDGPADLVRGEVVTMPPPGVAHGRVCLNVGFLLEQWNRQAGLGTVATNDTGVITERNPDTVRGCDVTFIRWDRLQNRTLPSGAFAVPPDLAAEVLSPSDRWGDVQIKIEEYLAAGVSEVWIIDPEERAVWVCQRGSSPQRREANDDLTSPSVLPGFSCRVADFFLHV